MKSPDLDHPLPVLRCGDEFTERFGSNWSGKRLRKGLMLALCLTIGPLLLIWIGAEKLQALPILGGMVWVIRELLKVSRFFASRICPHCGKPVGKGLMLPGGQSITRGRDGILHLHCQKCGGETRTDLRSYVGSSWPEKAS